MNSSERVRRLRRKHDLYQSKHKKLYKTLGIFWSDKLAMFYSGARQLYYFSRMYTLQNNKHITRALIGRKQCFCGVYCGPQLIRREIVRFSRIVKSVLLIYRRKTRNLHLFSLLFALYKELRSGKVRNFAEFFAELSQYVRTCFSSQWLWTENRWSTQIGEILASGVETRHFVELKLGDLSTVPCVIACNCNIRICSTFERLTAKSRISNAFAFLIILKTIRKIGIKMRSCCYPNLICFLFSFSSKHDLSL